MEEKLYLLEDIAEQIAEELSFAWIWGDGEGGYIFDKIREAYYKRNGRPSATEPTRKRNMTATKRRAVFERDAYRCVNCSSYTNLCVDHIHPWSLGGSDELDNLQTLCAVCNNKKSNNAEVN